MSKDNKLVIMSIGKNDGVVRMTLADRCPMDGFNSTSGKKRNPVWRQADINQDFYAGSSSASKASDNQQA